MDFSHSTICGGEPDRNGAASGQRSTRQLRQTSRINELQASSSPERRIDPDVVGDIAQVLDQQATRERSMAAAFLAVGRGGLARQHEKRAVAFEEAAALVREQA